MILLCGIRSETPLRLVAKHLEDIGEPFVVFHQRDFEDADVTYEIGTGGCRGTLLFHGTRYPLEDFKAIYTRMMDDRQLPELDEEPEDSPRRLRCRVIHDRLNRWIEIAPGRVVNRSAPQTSNSSKPYQAQIIRECGFLVPETLITNDPELVREFAARHKRVIYKSISGVRSIVQTLKESDFERIERIRWCPTQFQAFVPGTNLRVHTVGDEALAVAILSDATDYRYSNSQTGSYADLVEAELDPDLAQKCCRLAKRLELPVAGIDLKVTPDNEVYCFEVNPCPAFSYFELNSGQPISASIARYLAAA